MQTTDRKVTFLQQAKRLKLEQLARAYGIGTTELDILEPYIDAAAIVFANRSEILEGVTVTPEIMDAVRLTTLPIVDCFNALSAEVSSISRQVSALTAENNTLVMMLASKLGLDEMLGAALDRRLVLVEPPEGA